MSKFVFLNLPEMFGSALFFIKNDQHFELYFGLEQPSKRLIFYASILNETFQHFKVWKLDWNKS